MLSARSPTVSRCPPPCARTSRPSSRRSRRASPTLPTPRWHSRPGFPDQYTHRHSVNVTALGLLLGRTIYRRHGWVDYRGKRRFDGIEARLALLGMGLLLHDVGKIAIPAAVLNKPGPLDEGEWELMRTHPDAGVALLRSETISPLVKSVVRHHHERWDAADTRAASRATGSVSSRRSPPSPTSTTRWSARAPTSRPLPRTWASR